MGRRPVPPKDCLTCGNPIPRKGINNRKKYCSVSCGHAALRRDMVTCFWEKVDKAGPNGCWVWTASRKERGYGQFYWRGKMHRAHRLAWVLIKGDPGKLEVAHTCDNRVCVNLDHLFLATHQENMADQVAKDRHTRGERNFWAKLTDAQVLEIRSLYTGKRGEQAALARQYGISFGMVTSIVNRRTWRHI